MNKPSKGQPGGLQRIQHYWLVGLMFHALPS